MTATLRQEIAAAINRHSAENGSNTPDFILAEYLTDCLAAFDKAVNMRSRYFTSGPAGGPTVPRGLCPACGCNRFKWDVTHLHYTCVSCDRPWTAQTKTPVTPSADSANDAT